MSARGRGLVVAGLLLAAGLVTVDVVVGGPLEHFDWVVHRWTDHPRPWPLGVWWHVLAIFGQRGVAAVPAAVTAILTSIRQRRLRPALVALAAAVTVTVLVGALKVGVGRTAPGSGVDRVFAGGLEYPSGHSVNAVVLWGLTFDYVAALSDRARAWLSPRRRCVLAAVLGAAAGIGMTGLDYHWLSDVLAGWPLGVAIYLVVAAADPADLRARRG